MRKGHFGRVGIGILLAAACCAAGAQIACGRDMQAARARLALQSRVTPTAVGPQEAAVWGAGPPILVLHGAGGGHDQGRLIADAFVGDGFEVLAPSRFGYLRTPLPEDAGVAAQADALAALLDALGRERVAVVAMSGGAPPALQLALRHPERVSALVLLSPAPITPINPPTRRPAPTWLYQSLFSADLPYWALVRLAPGGAETMFDAPPALRRQLTAKEASFLRSMAFSFEPVSDRVAGLFNERAAIDPKASYPLEAIAAPLLVVHSRNDGINPFAIGETIAERASHASLFAPRDGGHLLLRHHEQIKARVRDFLTAATPQASPRG